MGGGTDGGCIEPTCTVCEWFLKLIILTDSTTPGSASTLLRVLLCADVFWLFAAERSVCCELFSLSFSALAARLRGAGVGRGGSESLGMCAVSEGFEEAAAPGKGVTHGTVRETLKYEKKTSALLISFS